MGKNLFGQFLLKERTRQGYTRPQLAKKAGLSTKSIELWEKGMRDIKLSNAHKLFRALGVTFTVGKSNSMKGKRRNK